MSYMIKRGSEEIDTQLNWAVEYEEKGGSAVPGMTYEQGVAAGIRWIVGDQPELPIEEPVEGE